jgi:hypothetical protein
MKRNKEWNKIHKTARKRKGREELKTNEGRKDEEIYNNEKKGKR